MGYRRIVTASATAALMVCALIVSAPLYAQASAKESREYEKNLTNARKELSEFQTQLVQTVALYNDLRNGDAEDPEKTHKALSNASKSTDRKWDAYTRAAKSLHKQATKLFESWTNEIDTFANEQMQALGRERLEVARTKYQTVAGFMSTLEETYAAWDTSLQDQVVFMSRDLTPEAMEILEPMSRELNALADKLARTVQGVLTGAMELEPAAEVTAEAAPEAAAEAEMGNEAMQPAAEEAAASGEAEATE